MDDSLLTSNNEQSTESSLETESSTAPRKTRKTVFIVVSAFILLFLCVGTYVASGLIKVAMERSDVSAVIDRFMREMEKKDVETAFEMFSIIPPRVFFSLLPILQ